MKAARYRIERADADNLDRDDLERLHVDLFGNKCPYLDTGEWWLAKLDGDSVGFVGIVPYGGMSPGSAYLARVGVLPGHRGNSLQLRMMRVAERFAKRCGFSCIVSDTTDNIHSANNFIRAGYLTYAPATPWAFSHSIYWRKLFGV
jgi:GNAT superfamily N-acetyltransferase